MATSAGSPFLNPLVAVLGYAVGTAAGPVLRPGVQDLANLAWETHAVRPPDALTLAAGVAQGQVDEATARAWAKQTGFDKAQMDALINIANVGPGLAQAYRMWRRNQVGEAGFRRAVKRLGLEQEWIDDLVALKEEFLDPAQLAVMIQRTVVPNPGILPNQPSTAGSNVPPMPQVDLNVETEAAAAGISLDRLKAMARIIGLPASPDLAARMHFRKIITEGAFNQAVLEGNTRGEWAPFLLDGFRQILTANEYTELQLRGYISEARRRELTALSGMSQDDSDRLYDVLGRSIAVRGITTGLARGGTYPGTYANVPQPYKAAIQRSNVKEEYSELAYANRYTYPSFFAIRALMQAGVFNADQGYEILLEMGWKPDLARKVADFYGQATTAEVAPEVKSAHTRALTLLRNAYVARRVDDAFATDRLTALGIDATVQGPLMDAWRIMQTIPGAGLTRAQVKKAFKSLPAEWPRDRALTELEDLGMEPEEAQTYLDE